MEIHVCKNCFLTIQDMRSEVRCNTCNSQLHKECAIVEDGTPYCDVCYTVKTEEVAVPQFELPEIIRRSYIELYKKCPFKFLNEVINGIESPTNIYAQLGIDLHDLFSKACKDRRYNYNHMKDDFYRHWNNYKDELFDGDMELKKKMHTRGLTSMSTFYHVLGGLPAIPHSCEETLRFSVGDDLPLVQCTSDRVDLVNGELELLDWKTGKVMVGMNHSTDLQAPLYIHSIRKKYQLPVRKFTFYYLDENKERVFNRIDHDNYECVVNKRKYLINITDAIREVQRMFMQIKTGNFNIPLNTKGMYYTCKMCHLQAQGTCKGADLESWRQYNK